LNLQENVWQFMRDNWLSNRVFDNDSALIDHCSDAWNKLEAQPWSIMSIGLRDWAHRFWSVSPGIGQTSDCHDPMIREFAHQQ
jgi:putative transposase